MAVRARLNPPPPERSASRWHEPKWTSLPLSAVAHGDRRLEAENYLASGFGLRAALEARRDARATVGEVARVWQPSRLKGILVAPAYGTPFLAATQVFDLRPVPRKWLSIARTHDSANRFIQSGTIVVTCSGNVGRATLTQAHHENTLITHDLLRVEPRSTASWGWLYAYLRTDIVRAMMTASRYGHIIKHLEPSHLDGLPIPNVRESLLSQFNDKVRQVWALRESGQQRMVEAEVCFEAAVGAKSEKDRGENGFTVRASQSVFGRRRRLEAAVHNPNAASIRRHLARHGTSMEPLHTLGVTTWLPNRFKRVPAVEGVELLDSSDFFEVNPDRGRIIVDADFGDPYEARVQPGWILLARSGQVYGLNGSAVMATAAHAGKAVSDDIIRIAPSGDLRVRMGYLFIALSHPTLGRPLVKAQIYGSSIPHLDVADVKDLPIVRLSTSSEDAIADLAESGSGDLAEADILERRVADDAQEMLTRYMAGDHSMLPLTPVSLR